MSVRIFFRFSISVELYSNSSGEDTKIFCILFEFSVFLRFLSLNKQLNKQFYGEEEEKERRRERGARMVRHRQAL